ncbi:Archaea bacterial proteins of uncharacterised function [uncultured archaeon]|nr:Archaea bacterial proteins of uncharacterised function [uncultured archaeon]
MSQQKFVNREEELTFLEDRYKSDSPELIIIYGRRRVGKTELMLRFLEEKEGIYFLASTEGDRQNIKQFSVTAGKTIHDENFGKIEYPDWQSLFESLFRHKTLTARKEKVIIIIDEFPFLIQNNKATPSIFQKIWDTAMKQENVMLILLGSAMSIMETEVLGYKSPLYGRRTGQWQVQRLDIIHLKEFLPYSNEELVKTWFVTGGIPEYILKFDARMSFWENILNNVLKKGSYLYRDAEFLLSEEFREPKNYMLIFKAIALGCNTLGEICNFTGLDRGMVSKYLDVLTRLHILKEEIPVTASTKFRKRLYFISDPYFNFYYRYIYPNRIDLEANRTGEVLELIKEDFSRYSGYMYEGLIRELTAKRLIFNPFPLSKIGKWWHKDREIDLVAVNETTKQILFVECKWKNVPEREARKIIDGLKEKAAFVQWNNESRKSLFGIAAKKIENKKRLIKEGFAAVDLDDIF